MKKMYVTPDITTYVVHVNNLCSGSDVGLHNQTVSGDAGGLSNSYAGGVMEDDTDDSYSWDK